MLKSKICLTGILVLAFLVSLPSCSKEKQQQPTQQGASSGQSAQAAPQQSAQETAAASQPGEAAAEPSQAAQEPPAATATIPASSKPSGTQATEKHVLRIANYAGTLVTASVNGVWVGQWDAHSDSPLESVVQGKNQLTIELQAEPKNTLGVEVSAQRAGQWVNLLRLNFQGKAAGTYTYSFVAR